MKIKNSYIIAVLCVALVAAVCVLVYVVVADDDADINTDAVSTTQKEYDYCMIYNACSGNIETYSNREDAVQTIERFEPHPSDCYSPQWMGCASKGELTEKMEQYQLEYCFAEVQNTDTGEFARPLWTGTSFNHSFGIEHSHKTTREEIEQYIETQRQDESLVLADNEELKITCVQDL